MEGRRWLVGAVAVFSVLLVVWIAAALLLSSASAGSLPISLNLRSRLKADYGSDEVFGPLKVFRLSIVNDRLLDGGLSVEEAEARSEAIESAFSLPVPTATALNFRGDAPYTATYTNTPTSTATPVPTDTPTATSTKTPRPTKTRTPIPTDTPEPPPEEPEPIKTPTKTPVSPGDTTPPEILDWSLDPAEWPTAGCSATIQVNELKILDPAYSEGIKRIKLEYYDPAQGKWIIALEETSIDPPNNWTLGKEWYDHYNFEINVNIGTTCPTSFDSGSGGTFISLCSESSPVTCDTSVTVKARVKDMAGNETCQPLGTYQVPECCVSD